jgi:fatty-acyl-CoA synthase
MGSLDLSRLRTIIVGSESVKADTLEQFTDSFAPAGFRPIAFSPGYGMAEATLAVTIVPPREPWHAVPRPDDPASAGPPRSLVSCGRAVAGVDVRVAGSNGSIGPIEFRSASMLSHYIGSELQLTDDGYFVTGDIGMMQDDELFVVGRGDEAIIVAGHVVYADDIEVAVQHESIRPSCVAAVAAPDGGLAIVVEPKAARLSTAELEDACRAIRRVVASRTGWPTATVAFVARGSLPKTPSGKLRRIAIGRLLSTNELLARVDFA